jgi:hypothetical protein
MELLIGIYIGIALLAIVIHILLHKAMEGTIKVVDIFICIGAGILWPLFYGYLVVEHISILKHERGKD